MGEGFGQPGGNPYACQGCYRRSRRQGDDPRPHPEKDTGEDTEHGQMHDARGREPTGPEDDGSYCVTNDEERGKNEG